MLEQYKIQNYTFDHKIHGYHLQYIGFDSAAFPHSSDLIQIHPFIMPLQSQKM